MVGTWTIIPVEQFIFVFLEDEATRFWLIYVYSSKKLSVELFPAVILTARNKNKIKTKNSYHVLETNINSTAKLTASKRNE